MRLIVAAFIYFTFTVYQSAFAQSLKNEIEIKTENDSYLGILQDKYYTNGLFVTYRCALPATKKTVKRIYALSVGQKIFNPYSGAAPYPEYHDRPFAGYLYVGNGYKFFYSNESMLNTEIEMGFIGKYSLAEEAQKLIHRIGQFYVPSGWEYQIKNSFSINSSIQYLKLIGRSNNHKIDLFSDNQINLGSSFTNAQIGLTMRIGNINPLYESAFANARIHHQEQSNIKNELFLYLKPKINLIAYDETIKGNLFNQNSPVTFSSKPIVLSQEIGINYSTKKITTDVSVIFKTREIQSHATADQYGCIRLFYRF